MQSGEGREWLPFFKAATTREENLDNNAIGRGSALNNQGERVCAFSAQFLSPYP